MVFTVPFPFFSLVSIFKLNIQIQIHEISLRFSSDDQIRLGILLYTSDFLLLRGETEVVLTGRFSFLLLSMLNIRIRIPKICSTHYQMIRFGIVVSDLELLRDCDGINFSSL